VTDPPLASIVNVMTVDVEEYFQVSAFEGIVPRDSWSTHETRVEASTLRLLDLFGEAGIRATFFVLGVVAERHPDLVRRIGEAGHELASHSHSHRLVYALGPAEFREDLRRARGAIEMTSGRPVRGFRAPSFSITAKSLWALDILVEEGFAYDASVFPIHHDRYGIPRAPLRPFRLECPSGGLIEVPATKVTAGGIPLPIGGGYFRLLPYALTRWAIARLNRTEAQPAVVYVHPWELDPSQPRLPASWLSTFRHYNQLAQTAPRLSRLLGDFRFGPIEQVVLPLSCQLPVHPIERLARGATWVPKERPGAGEGSSRGQAAPARTSGAAVGRDR